MSVCARLVKNTWIGASAGDTTVVKEGGQQDATFIKYFDSNCGFTQFAFASFWHHSIYLSRAIYGDLRTISSFHLKFLPGASAAYINVIVFITAILSPIRQSCVVF